MDNYISKLIGYPVRLEIDRRTLCATFVPYTIYIKTKDDMKTISEVLSADHVACDNEFARAEEAALANKWSEAGTAFNAFRDAMAHHFKMEEEVLFPTLKSAGGPAGPVHVMLMEHAQIKELLKQMAEAVAQKNAKSYGGLSETLLIVMQQHNHKEENILYGMADDLLANDRESLLERMQAV